MENMLISFCSCFLVIVWYLFGYIKNQIPSVLVTLINLSLDGLICTEVVL